jgi:hypothetical protein
MVSARKAREIAFGMRRSAPHFARLKNRSSVRSKEIKWQRSLTDSSAGLIKIKNQPALLGVGDL